MNKEVILPQGYEFKAEFIIKPEAYAKLMEVSEMFGQQYAKSMFGLYLNDIAFSFEHDMTKDEPTKINVRAPHGFVTFMLHFPSNYVQLKAYAGSAEAYISEGCLKSQCERENAINNEFTKTFRRVSPYLEFLRGATQINGGVQIKNKSPKGE